MKKILVSIGIALIAAVGALGWTFSAAPLPVPADFVVQIPVANSPPELSLSVLHAGKMYSKSAFAFRGGEFGEERVFGMAGILVRHPQGALLLDAGFGKNVDAHFRTTPFLMQAMSKYEKEPPVADQLKAAGFDLAQIKGVVITHAHWDHVSGIEDLRGVPVWVPQAELDFIRDCNLQSALICGFGDLPYQVYAFPDGPYLGFESSFDVFKDGSVVIVPAPGHTPGSVITFVALADGNRYAFIGDLAWQKEGIAIPAERPWLPRQLLREDAANVRRWLVLMHQLQALVPKLTIVPAHDRRVLETLPRFES